MANISSCGFIGKLLYLFPSHDSSEMVIATLKIQDILQFDVILRDMMSLANTGFIIYFICIIKNTHLLKIFLRMPKPL